MYCQGRPGIGYVLPGQTGYRICIIARATAAEAGCCEQRSTSSGGRAEPIQPCLPSRITSPRLPTRRGSHDRSHRTLVFSFFLTTHGRELADLIRRLAGKVAVITGAASGIGKATAAEFVRNGAKVILADVQDDLGRAVAAELGAYAAYTRCDVTDEAQVAAAVDLAVARHGHLDIIFNNAGISGNLTPTPVSSIDLADFDRVLATNTRAVLAGVKHAARVMVPRRRGSIICTASTAAVIGGVTFPPYSISKAAVVGLVRAVAGEMASSGVRVNAISPNYIPTPLVMGVMAERFPGMSADEHKRIVERDVNEIEGVVLGVEDIATAAVYLASDEAKYVNGHNLVIDGGFTVSKSPNMPAPEH